jgi:endonuclease/exonuclease/phosphatase (EEP) superfamily protein YafD
LFWLTFPLGIFISVLSLCALLGQFHWLLDLSSHFVIQYALILSICLVLGRFSSKPNLVLWLLPVWFLQLLWLAPFFIPNQAGALAASAPLKVLSFNVYVDNTHNAELTKVARYLEAQNADILFLSEVKPELLRALAPSYPFVLDESASGTLGLAFLSKYTFDSSEVVTLPGRRRRLLKIDLNWQGQKVSLYGVHPFPPLGKRWAESRDNEIAALSELLQASKQASIVLGDFNASPWSRPMRRLTKEARLNYAAEGFGLRPTWSYKSLLVSAPIDHILINQAWQVTSYAYGSKMGSDHLPIASELRLSQP